MRYFIFIYFKCQLDANELGSVELHVKHVYQEHLMQQNCQLFSCARQCTMHNARDSRHCIVHRQCTLHKGEPRIFRTQNYFQYSLMFATLPACMFFSADCVPQAKILLIL